MAVALLTTFVIGLVIGLPVALVMGLATLAAFLADGSLPLQVLPQRFFSGIDSFPMMAIPFFILAADLMTAGRLTETLIRLSNHLVGHIRGGLGHVNVLVSVFFSGISGSALADAAGPGAVVMRMMRDAGYEKYYSGSLSAATAIIGPIIPPSIMMVIYALTDDRTSVTGLFLAGIVPGILLGLSLMLMNYLISRRRNFRTLTDRTTLRELLQSFVKAIPSLIMPLIIVGGILGGVFTPTEAAAVAVGYALLVGLFVTRTLSLKKLPHVFLKSAIMSASVLLLVSMGSAFSWALTFAQVPQDVAMWISSLTENSTMIIVLIAAVAVVVGMFVDTMPAVIILTPVLSPIAVQFGIDPLHVAIVIVLSLAVGMLTPPVAPVLFVISTVGRLRFERLAVAVVPLLVAEFIVIGLITLIPELSTWLPNVFGYGK